MTVTCDQKNWSKWSQTNSNFFMTLKTSNNYFLYLKNFQDNLWKSSKKCNPMYLLIWFVQFSRINMTVSQNNLSEKNTVEILIQILYKVFRNSHQWRIAGWEERPWFWTFLVFFSKDKSSTFNGFNKRSTWSRV